MGKTTLFSFILVLKSFGICGQAPFDFKSLRYDENYEVLKNDTAQDWYSKLKYRVVGDNKRSYLSFGGEARFQYLWYKNADWGDAPADEDGYVLSRFLAHADFHLNKSFRTFIQIQSSLANGKINTNPIEENPLEVHQAFVDMRLGKNKKSILFRVGRQELSYGSQRLISVREGPNNRQSFDALKAVRKTRQHQLDVFYSHFVASKKGLFDDGFNRNTKFWGAYFVRDPSPNSARVDLYYLGLWKKLSAFDDGIEKELRHSVGFRIWNNRKKFKYDYEALWQWGDFGEKLIRGWTISFHSSYRFESSRYRPELGLKAELISGDAQYNDDRLQTFNPLFPRGAYFGLAALIGPSDLKDIHPSVSLELSKQVKLNLDSDFFWRFSRSDGIYAPNVALIYSGKNNPSKYIGSQYAGDLVYTPNNFLYFRTEFTWFDAGDFLRSAGSGKDIIFTAFTVQFKF